MVSFTESQTSSLNKDVVELSYGILVMILLLFLGVSKNIIIVPPQRPRSKSVSGAQLGAFEQ